jgi:hypothetical protein
MLAGHGIPSQTDGGHSRGGQHVPVAWRGFLASDASAFASLRGGRIGEQRVASRMPAGAGVSQEADEEGPLPLIVDTLIIGS